MRRQIRIQPDMQGLCKAAAEHVTGVLEATLRQKTMATFVLTGGTTPRPLYELLAAAPYRERLDWARIHFFWGDERCEPPDSPASNFGMAKETLLSKVPAPEEHIHRMLGELEDPETAARLYEVDIRRLLPDNPTPVFDLILLGMGADGHSASLFPETDWDEERLVVSHFVPKLAAWRITMTPRLLNEASAILFLVAGSTKARALAGVLEGPEGTFPAQRIRPAHGSMLWLVDKEAAALLPALSHTEEYEQKRTLR